MIGELWKTSWSTGRGCLGTLSKMQSGGGGPAGRTGRAGGGETRPVGRGLGRSGERFGGRESSEDQMGKQIEERVGPRSQLVTGRASRGRGGSVDVGAGRRVSKPAVSRDAIPVGDRSSEPGAGPVGRPFLRAETGRSLVSQLVSGPVPARGRWWTRSGRRFPGGGRGPGPGFHALKASWSTDLGSRRPTESGPVGAFAGRRASRPGFKTASRAAGRRGRSRRRPQGAKTGRAGRSYSSVGRRGVVCPRIYSRTAESPYNRRPTGSRPVGLCLWHSLTLPLRVRQAGRPAPRRHGQ